MRSCRSRTLGSADNEQEPFSPWRGSTRTSPSFTEASSSTANGAEITHASVTNTGPSATSSNRAAELAWCRPGRGGGIGKLGITRRYRVGGGRLRCARGGAAASRATAAGSSLKTDNVDAGSTTLALLAEPSLGPVQGLEVYDALVAKVSRNAERRPEQRRVEASIRYRTITGAVDQTPLGERAAARPVGLDPRQPAHAAPEPSDSA